LKKPTKQHGKPDNIIVGFTGHRRLYHPEKAIEKRLRETLHDLNPKKCISGMAYGFDQLAANVAFYMNIPFIAAVPSKDQAARWSKRIIMQYNRLLEKAEKVVYVDKEMGKENGPYIPKLFARNKWILEHSDFIVAYKVKEYGGTASLVALADLNKVEVFNLTEIL